VGFHELLDRRILLHFLDCLPANGRYGCCSIVGKARGVQPLKAVPDSFREAALALGATRWQMVRRVLLPAARNGLLAAALLGVGRAVGETMAVLMATGHSIRIATGPLDPVRTMTATIAAELGETAVGSDHYQVLFIIGILLFSIHGRPGDDPRAA
jgi:phosphate transport system permease protein